MGVGIRRSGGLYRAIGGVLGWGFWSDFLYMWLTLILMGDREGRWYERLSWRYWARFRNKIVLAN